MFMTLFLLLGPAHAPSRSRILLRILPGARDMYFTGYVRVCSVPVVCGRREKRNRDSADSEGGKRAMYIGGGLLALIIIIIILVLIFR
jgi:hypothetical protein